MVEHLLMFVLNIKNMETLNINKEKAINIYQEANNEQKQVLEELFGVETLKPKTIIDKIKTFEDACYELGETHPFVSAYLNTHLRDPYIVEINRDLLAYMKLCIITTALNEGWKPQFTEDEWRWYPRFTLLNREELFMKTDKWKIDKQLISIDGYSGEYAGFFCSGSNCAPSPAYTQFSSCLCFKNETLATYCGKQFIYLWAAFTLIKK